MIKKILINNPENAEALMQEIYNNAVEQVKQAQDAIDAMVNQSKQESEGVMDYTSIAKETGNLLKLKDAAIGRKLEVMKMQLEFLKYGKSNSGGSGDEEKTATVGVTKKNLDELKSLVKDMVDLQKQESIEYKVKDIKLPNQGDPEDVE